MTRDFDDEGVVRPQVSIEGILEECQRCDLRPVVWLEELDKIVFSKTKTDLIDSLIDAVYQAEGLLIMTSNATKEELKERLPLTALRRVVGSMDKPERFKSFDFHKELKRKG